LIHLLLYIDPIPALHEGNFVKHHHAGTNAHPGLEGQTLQQLWKEILRKSRTSAPVRRVGRKQGLRSLSPAISAWKFVVKITNISITSQQAEIGNDISLCLPMSM